MRLIDMFSLLITCYLNNTFCTEMPNDLSTTESIIISSFINQNEKKQSILTQTESQKQELLNYVQNLNKLYKFINANKEQTRNEKLKIILNVLKIELTNVKNKFNRVNFSEFLNNSIELIEKFTAAYLNKADRDDAIVLHETIEKFISKLENIDTLHPNLKKLNMNFFNLIKIRYKLYSYKKQVEKLREAFSEYLNFLNKNDENLILHLFELSSKLKCKFKEMKRKSSLFSEVEAEKLSLIFHDNLYGNVSDLYEELIEYFNQEQKRLECVFINLDEIWNCSKKHLETYGLFF
ncbi:hypothetical protein NBO_78g0013 [Nosema bombycis CQ1]|uniref:Uncharacterized protein n=1 Tax=Nosema bombycis (strain CQ1 / CVCC 102059) TaxID=578461 RepID=R0KT51_NOSB1|nr:hypothetical protein NBO_78g0013 [Nosema bombycis CQ1]|eukprot:EOB13387.1 hypothetical protein NBO_78g0013 [Nosema bombycis CQ1]